MIKIQIKNRFTGTILFEYEKENNSMKETVEKAIESEADLSKANLSGANLSWANLSWANLSGANLSWANLSTIRNDFWDVLLHAILEVPALKLAVVEGRVDGSTYEGECACLLGTLEKQDRFRKKWNGDLRDSRRPIERFFMGIKKGDTPENNPVSKIVLQWINEFENYLK